MKQFYYVSFKNLEYNLFMKLIISSRSQVYATIERFVKVP
jgi:hypothetical protein